MVGAGVDIETARALAAEGVDAGDHVARRLTERRVAQADLVLAAEGSHRLAVAELRPDAISRTFTLREFERLAIAAIEGKAHGPQGLVEVAVALRGACGDRAGGRRHRGPIGGPTRRTRAAVRTISSATYAVAAALHRDRSTWAARRWGSTSGGSKPHAS